MPTHTVNSPPPPAILKRVAIESPYAGATPEILERNLRYVRACMRDCLLRGETPIASHALYTQPDVLDDSLPADRELGMRAGWNWFAVVDFVAVYVDLGISGGMQRGIVEATRIGRPLVYRQLLSWIDGGIVAAELEGEP